MRTRPVFDTFDPGRQLRRGVLRAGRRVAMALVVLLLALAMHWKFLLDGQREQMAMAEARIQLRGAQLAHSLAMHIGSLVSDIDSKSAALAAAWVSGDDEGFRRLQDLALHGLPHGAMVDVAVFDVDGRLVHVSRPDILTEAPLRLPDPGDLVIGKPRRTADGGPWQVPFARAALRGGEPVGTVVVAIASDHLSGVFRDVFPDEGDAVLLARNDGVFLARSHRFDEIAGGNAAGGYGFIQASPEAVSGHSRAVSRVDGVDRLYAFHRVPGYALTVNVGLDASTELAPVREAIRTARRENIAATVLVLLAAVALAWMFLLRERNALMLAQSREQLELALAGGELGTWDWDIATGRTRFNARWAGMLGYRVDEIEPNIASWEGLIHPDDSEAVRQAMQLHLQGRTPHYESEHRMRHRDGHWVWVLDRGQVVERGPDGAPLRAVGTYLNITPRKQAEAIVAESRERLQRLVAEVPGVVYQYLQRPDGSACFPYASPGMVQVYGISDAEAAASAEKVFAIIHRDDLERVKATIEESMRELSPWRCEYRVTDPDGRVRWLLGHANPQRLEDGSTLWHGYIYDVTEQHHAAAELEAGRLRLTTLLERFPGGVLMEDADDVVVVVNEGLCELFGLAERPADLVGLSHEALTARLGSERSGWLFEPGGGRRSIEVAVPGGRALEIDWVPIARGEERLGRVWLVRDITARKQREAALETLATTDSLTGLPNRRSFIARLEAAIAEARHLPPGEGAVLMLDLDHFKRVNDTWGHAVGDDVLRYVAGLIRQGLRRKDVPGRLGGEEFAVLLPGTTLENARQLAERLRERFEGSPADTPVGAVPVTVSIGIAPLDGQDADRVLERADEALYAAKSAGRNRVCVAGEAA